MAPDLRTVLESLAPVGAPPADRLTAVFARARQRRRRTQAAAVALSVAAVTTVVVVAGLGSSGTGPKQTPVAHPASTLLVNPDQVLLADDQQGYALFNKVCRGTEGDCTSLLYATTDGARTWHPMTLPPGMPLGTEKYEILQASGSDLFLPWSNGDWVSTDQGSSWKPVRVGSTQSTTFVQASNSEVQLVDAAHATMATLPLPQGISLSGLSAGLLPGGRVWVSSGSEFDVSPDAGRTWTPVALPVGEDALGVRYNGSGDVSVLTGRPDPTLTLVAHVVTLTGGTRAVQGPGVPPACAAMLADGTLLAIAQPDGLPYRLPPGQNTFVRDPAGPSGPLGCLATGDGNPLWVTGPGNQLLGQQRRQDLALGDAAPGEHRPAVGSVCPGSDGW